MTKPRRDGWRWRQLRLTILARDAWTCRWCLQPATTVDHVQAVAEGGTDDPANLVAACWKCQGERARETMKNTHGWL